MASLDENYLLRVLRLRQSVVNDVPEVRYSRIQLVGDFYW